MMWHWLWLVIGVVAANSCQNSGYVYRSNTRFYCIMASEINWNFAPNSTMRRADLTGKFEDRATTILYGGDINMGPIVRKAVYRQYIYNNDINGCDWSQPSQHDRSNGILGPTIRAVVGDAIKVIFYNNCSRPYSIRPHGLFYTQGFNDQADPGVEVSYDWYAMQTSGPDLPSISSRVWMYHSSADSEEKDLNSGLVGAIVVVNPEYIATNEQRKAAWPCDMDFEFVLAMCTFNEAESWYSAENAENLIGFAVEEDNSTFVQSNMRYTLNGLMYGNLEGRSFPAESIVRWHVLSAQTNSLIESETLRWDNNPVKDANGHFTDYAAVAAPGYASVTMSPKSVGRWPMYNGNTATEEAGMIALFTVTDEPWESRSPESSDSSSSLGHGHLYRFFVIVILFGVMLALGLLYLSVRGANLRLTGLRGDGDPILADSTHHVALSPFAQTGELNGARVVKHAEL